MLDCLIDHIFVEFGRHIFQQIIDIPIRTNLPWRSVPIIIWDWVYNKKHLSKTKQITEAKTFNLTFMYIDVFCQVIIKTLISELHYYTPKNLILKTNIITFLWLSFYYFKDNISVKKPQSFFACLAAVTDMILLYV